jgi:hypothetical protein
VIGLSPTAVSAPAAGTRVFVEVTTATTGCAWTAISAASWITLDPAAGAGPRTVQVSVAANDGTATRESTVTIGGRTLQVTQSAGVGEPRQLEGRVEALGGACPELTWRMNGTRVATTRSTAFVANSCSRFREGVTVEVKGEERAGVLEAKQVRIVD